MLFRKAAEGDSDSLDAAMDGCRSTVDWPGVYFWRELVEFILFERDFRAPCRSGQLRTAR